jgi:hypothetical protein
MGISIGGLIYLVIGVIVAYNFGYIANWNVVGNLIEGLLAVVVWPVLLFGVDLHALIA